MAWRVRYNGYCCSADKGLTFSITNTKLYVPIVLLSAQDNEKRTVYNEKLLEQLNSFLKRRINWNKYQSKISTEIKKQYLDYLIDLSF